MQRLAARLQAALYPELRSLPPDERGPARARASQEPFDLIEWGGILLGIVVATSLTRYSGAGLTAVERLSMLILSFAAALPLLAVLVGPFLVRRTRRGIAKELRKRIV